jgi:hypothetical protein
MNKAINLNIPYDLLRTLQIAYQSQGVELEDRMIELLYMDLSGILEDTDTLNSIRANSPAFMLLCDRVNKLKV